MALGAPTWNPKFLRHRNTGKAKEKARYSTGFPVYSTPDIPPQVTFASPKFIYDSNGTVKAIFFQSLQLLKGFVKANKELIKDFVIVLPLEALGAIRIDYRRKDFSNYLLSPTLINAPSS